MSKLLFVLCSILMFTMLSADIGEEVSALFTMDTADPVVNVLNPNGGETLLSNQQTAISWTAVDGHLTGNTINIKFSPNNGSNYQTISIGESNDGNYNWTVPVAYTEFVLMKISATDDFGNYAEDISDAVFSIMWQANFGVSSIFAMDTADPTLDLTSPNGGEEWYIGSTHDILWSASDNNLPANPIIIEFSTSGANYETLSENEFNDGIYAWDIPITTTEQGRIKIIVADTFGNLVEDISSSTFIIGYVPPQAPQNVTVDVSNGIDAVISWNAVTQNTEGEEVIPDGYIVLYNEVPTEEENEDFYYFLGATSNLTMTHFRVAEFREQQFYMVVAYIDHNGRSERIITNYELRMKNSKNKDSKVSWAELKKELK
ncbi:MAG: hypothetical protein U9N34_02555 [Candidatus Cloacimonadota bacterium]|nr:hypothetical protein [Candidatus Cloacimonadota bacterium]